MTRTDSLRLAVVDDHDIVLRGIKALAADHSALIQSVITGASAAEVIEKADSASGVDVVLLDVNLEGGVGVVEGVQALTQANMRVLLYTADLRPVPIRRGIQAGALGVALKSDASATLIGMIESVAAGEFAASSELAHLLAIDESLCTRLAPKELAVLRLLAAGVPKGAIGRRMDPPITLSTVQTYFNRIAEKYEQLGREVGNVYGALREAEKDGHLS